jgi:hypothetical protein
MVGDVIHAAAKLPAAVVITYANLTGILLSTRLQ